MRSPATRYPAPWIAMTGMMPNGRVRYPPAKVPVSTAMPSAAANAPNTRPRWESSVFCWKSVSRPAMFSAPGRPTMMMPASAGHTAT